jgi:hypothetical protein
MKRVVALWQQYYKRENGGRTRETEEKNGQHEVSLKLDVKVRRGAFLLREGRKRDPPCMLYTCHFIIWRVHSRGAHYMRERGRT